MAGGTLWKHRDFTLLWAGQSVSELGSQVSVLAIPLVAIDGLHAGVFAVGLLASLQTLPFLVIGLPAGALIDRMRRRPVLIAADVGRTVALGSVPLMWGLGVLAMPQLYAVSVVSGVLTVFFDVAYQSYLPALIRKDQLVEGNGKLAASMAGAQIAGPGVGGLLVGLVGAASAITADATSFAMSFLSLAAIRTHEERVPPAPQRNLRREIGEGLGFVLREPRIRAIAGSTGTSNFFSAMTFAVLLVFLRRQIHLSAAHIGLLIALGGFGGIIGASVAGRVARRIGVGRTIVAAIIVAGIGQLAYPAVTRGDADLLVAGGGFVVGIGGVAYNINQLSLRQALCPLPLQGRMNASVRFLVWGTMPLGGLAGGALGAALGLRQTLGVAAAGGLAAVLWVVLSPVPQVRVMPE